MVVRIRSGCCCCCCFSAFPNGAQENVEESSADFSPAGQANVGAGAAGFALFYCQVPSSSAFSSVFPSPLGLDLGFLRAPHSP